MMSHLCPLTYSQSPILYPHIKQALNVKYKFVCSANSRTYAATKLLLIDDSVNFQ